MTILLKVGVPIRKYIIKNKYIFYKGVELICKKYTFIKLN